MAKSRSKSGKRCKKIACRRKRSSGSKKAGQFIHCSNKRRKVC